MILPSTVYNNTLYHNLHIKMKTLIYLTLVIALSGSCRAIKKTYRTDHYAEMVTSQKKIGRSVFGNDNSDSLWRYWHFNSDVPFYFHPDSGVYAINGAVRVEEGRTHRQNSMWIQDTSTWQNHKEQILQHEEAGYSVRTNPLLWVAIGGMTCLAFLLIFWHRK